jgi:hypothetical protein
MSTVQRTPCAVWPTADTCIGLAPLIAADRWAPRPRTAPHPVEGASLRPPPSRARREHSLNSHDVPLAQGVRFDAATALRQPPSRSRGTAVVVLANLRASRQPAILSTKPWTDLAPAPPPSGWYRPVLGLRLSTASRDPLSAPHRMSRSRGGRPVMGCWLDVPVELGRGERSTLRDPHRIKSIALDDRRTDAELWVLRLLPLGVFPVAQLRVARLQDRVGILLAACRGCRPWARYSR